MKKIVLVVGPILGLGLVFTSFGKAGVVAAVLAALVLVSALAQLYYVCNDSAKKRINRSKLEKAIDQREKQLMRLQLACGADPAKLAAIQSKAQHLLDAQTALDAGDVVKAEAEVAAADAVAIP